MARRPASIKRIALTPAIRGIDDPLMLVLPSGLDPDLLRSFVLIAEGGSFTRAAQTVGRTQSAVSMQIRRLEDVLGQPLLIRNGRGIELTPHGEWLLDRARQLLTLNDEIMASFRSPAVAGRVRLGTPDDYVLRYLPTILARFSESHPAVEVEVVCSNSTDLVERLQRGELDLALVSDGNQAPGMQAIPLWRGPLAWVGSVAHTTHRRDPLPLALAHPACVWRQATLAALEAAGRRWRIAYTSAMQAGTLAPALAGLAVTVCLPGPLPAGLRWLGPEDGLPSLPEFGIVLLRGPAALVTDALAEHIEAGFRLEASNRS
jgi:DNA-binding transcriptional LysR family regulator